MTIPDECSIRAVRDNIAAKGGDICEDDSTGKMTISLLAKAQKRGRTGTTSETEAYLVILKYPRVGREDVKSLSLRCWACTRHRSRKEGCGEAIGV